MSFCPLSPRKETIRPKKKKITNILELKLQSQPIILKLHFLSLYKIIFVYKCYRKKPKKTAGSGIFGKKGLLLMFEKGLAVMAE